ncbi:hypothetical protein [Candidatus Albibeggiatoa sp. nov. NOAA]|uniref:DsrE family protein n=1 Tax=Candidatus Albibeggiatoa sp. nov. NOAA TaxID=3162724 RepID=UPI0033048D7F|nr:DsrE family protein [Thiotrichaceae bacterium]
MIHNLTQYTIASILSLCLLASNVALANQDDDFFEPEHKVVIQVSTNDPQTHNIVLNNAVNLQKAFGVDNVVIEVVAYGPGLSIFTPKSPASKRVPSLAMQNIHFSLCGNTLEKVTKKQGKAPKIVDGVGIVQSGAMRIVELQEQSYSYLRP